MSRKRKNGDYEVGRGRPPEETRFRKGKSGNPRGRPKGSLNIKTELLEILAKPISIQEDGKKRRVSRHQAMILRQVMQALGGDAKSHANVLKLVREYLGDEVKAAPSLEEETEAQSLTLAGYRERVRQDLEDEITAKVRAEMEERLRHGQS